MGAVGASSASAQSVIGGPIQNPADGHWNMLLSNYLMPDARAFATSLGGYDVTVNDAGENEWVRADMANLHGTARHGLCVGAGFAGWCP